VSRGQIAALVVLLGGVVFGALGGEYGTVDWWQLRQQVKAERSAVYRLKVELDSLRREAEALEHDPATQERVAREEFGMIRPGEILFRVEKVKP
jgi:cell division protein FtsB